ncbi:PD40 domain-containing protein [Cellulomonas sp. JH27-2]|uniref:TolB family protein n=1 Tax=Cellulomonas sp. JH27-2 TaxID=2774139 RepID=UPI00177C5D96|nr:PD40 domain-containing protein [Cellulomonas sp. JH27-2]MBD8057720.1 PD40 domain-containing protein [Cellulomonas sp. JH27-2]
MRTRSVGVTLALGCWAALGAGCSADHDRAVAGSAFATAVVPSRTGAASEVDGHLYFTHTTAGDVQTVLVTDGGNTRELTPSGAACCVVRVSPDGGRILTLPGDFVSPLTGATLDVTDDAAELVPLPRTDPSLNMVPLAWSPDGTRIAYEAWDDDDPSRTGIYTARVADGGGVVRVTTRPGTFDDVPLDYSPDGDQLVFYRSVNSDPDPYTGGSLWVVNVDGSDAHQISTPEAPPTVWARWSPDGTRILFAAERLSAVGPIWTVAPDGSDLTVVYQDDEGGFAIAPDWSPDGNRIVFGLDPGNDEFAHPPNVVYVVPAAGGAPVVVDDSDTFKRSFDWVE